MARSHLTLAALATAAIPNAGIIGSGPLTLGETGDYDAALLRTDDGRELVARTPLNDAAHAAQAIELLVLGSLTTGIRSRLPFDVPAVLGQVASRAGRTVITEYLPGRVISGEGLPPGDGPATSMGIAVAAIHALPSGFVGEAGLPVLSAAECRGEARSVIDRAVATRTLPTAVRERWLAAVADESFWQFHPVVVNGTLSAESFLLTEHEAGSVVSGVLGWSGLQVSDPARDLRWVPATGAAAESVFASYEQHAVRAPDPYLRRRALLHAELDLARWLLHGHDSHDSAIVADAVQMLDALVDTVLSQQADTLLSTEDPVLGVADVEALLTRTPDTVEPGSAAGAGPIDDVGDWRDDLPASEEPPAATGPQNTVPHDTGDPVSSANTDDPADAASAERTTRPE